ncbi:MAG: Beta-barrel assembly-enhancing protease [Phycisphaerales bacterium]|nr:Beta-barrel assembly-enhancing protease [Phycisphaerales bacterium]
MSTTSPAYQAARKLYDEGRLVECRQSLQRALQRSPGDADLNMLMGGVLVEMGQPEGAVYFLERACSISPQNHTARSILAEALMHSGKLAAAEKAFRAVVAAEAVSYSPRINLANILIRQGTVGEAETLLREAAAIRPERFEALNNLALLMLDCGRADEAAAMIRARRDQRPGDPAVNRCLANILNYVDEAREGESLEAHRVHGDWLVNSAAAAAAQLPPLAAAGAGGRRIRLGYMSPDFREHSVAYFVEPILRNHDRSRFEVFAYSSTGSVDARTERFKTLVEHWRDIARINDVAAARQVRQDGIDILVDLAGLTNNHRLGVLALRGAPVQVTYCGYPSTTGLSTVDYRIVDEVTDPPGFESRCVETLLRLKGPGSFSCYDPPVSSPEPAWDSSGPVTFGSFNVLSKVTPGVVALWCRVLREAPGTRLILKARSLADGAVRGRYEELVRSHGIESERVELMGPVASVADHLAVYSRVAVALDPFPYNGTTTTYEALWMGVPVVTLAGRTHAGRVGASILTGLGEHGLIAQSVDEYVAKAVELAQDVARVGSYRRTLRHRLKESALCDAAGFTRRFEEALEEAGRSSKFKLQSSD